MVVKNKVKNYPNSTTSKYTVNILENMFLSVSLFTV